MSNYRGAVTEFQLASTLSSSAKPLIGELSSANNATVRQLRVTDAKISCGGTARLVKVYGKGQLTKGLQLDMPANSVQNFSWQIPFKLRSVSSTGEVRGIYASASGAGVKIAISGYIEK